MELLTGLSGLASLLVVIAIWVGANKIEKQLGQMTEHLRRIEKTPPGSS